MMLPPAHLLRAATLAAATFFSLVPMADATTELPKLLQSGVPLGEIGTVSGDGIVFRIVVPEEAKNLAFKLSGGTGDGDLYIRHGAYPTIGNNDGASENFGNADSITIAAPEAGNWYVLVQASSTFQGAKLRASYDRTPATKPVPQLSPAPGSYPKKANVTLKCPVRGCVLHFTTDGMDPTEASPIYRRTLTFTADADLRVRAFRNGHGPGPVVQGNYFVTAPGSVIELANGMALTHRASIHGQSALFKITVPAGRARLDFSTQGGTGDSDLYVRQGAPPTTKIYAHHSNGSRNAAQIHVKNPAAGDWFILLRARSNFSRCAIVASYAGAKADLTVWADTLQPYLSVESFVDGDCEVDEGMIAAGTHTLLRFSTESRNIGGGDLVMPPIHNPDGSVNPIYEYHACHDHFHFLGFARYRLLDAQNQPVATGRKVSFCLEDVEQWNASSPADSKFDCDHQGIQAGWSDIYDAGLPGQWLDVTDVPPGTYTLEVTIDPDHLLDEDDFSNNTVTVPVEIAP